MNLLGELLYRFVDPVAEKQQQGQRRESQEYQLGKQGVDHHFGLGCGAVLKLVHRGPQPLLQAPAMLADNGEAVVEGAVWLYHIQAATFRPRSVNRREVELFKQFRQGGGIDAVIAYQVL